jgi:hypothetical protein
MSVLCGIAALTSSRSGKVVKIADLMPEIVAGGASTNLKAG